MAKDEAYRKAEERIEQARQEGATELDLSKMRLTEVPEQIASLTQLQRLDLSENRLTEVSPALAELSQLQQLNLSDNELEEVPEEIASLAQLQELDLSINELTQLPAAFARLSQLKVLKLGGFKFELGQIRAGNKLSELPEAIAQLTGLQKLDLSGNQLTQLPEAIAQLTELQQLYLSGNQLTKLPEAIAQLTGLEELDLSRNQLTELPEALAQLTGLQQLKLWDNQLTELPEALAQLTGLQQLDLSENRLTQLPEAIAQLTELQQLDLSGNKLTQLPEALAQLTGLQELKLSHNRLTQLPEEIAQLTGLQQLDLEGNKLTELPEALGQLTELQVLNLSGNRLNKLPEALAQLTGLQEFYLSENQLTEVPEAIAQLTGLQQLNLSGNQLTEVPEAIAQLTELQVLDLSGNRLNKLPEAIAQLTELQQLDLSGNQLSELPEAISQLTGLRQLNLSGNQLTQLPEAIGQLTGLQQLNLSRNQLTQLPEAIGQLTGLQQLDLWGNQLTQLPEAIAQLTGLQQLNLWDNQLTEVPEALAQLTGLQKLYFSDNQLTQLPEAISQLTGLQQLNLSRNQLTQLPEAIAQLTELQQLNLSRNRLTQLPEAIAQLTGLQVLYLSGNQLTEVPEAIAQLTGLQQLYLSGNQLTEVPEAIAQLTGLQELYLSGNQLTQLPAGLGRLANLLMLDLDENPLNPILEAADEQGSEVVLEYLRAKAEGAVKLYEAKLILVGEGATGKSSLLAALRGDEWVEDRETTHGVEIKPVEVISPDGDTKIVLNGWDFGGQDVYRPTHQLFFSAPAVYLAVWKPREGLQQNLVEEWLTLVKHRAPEAKVLVVATHGGPGARQPNVDRYYLQERFGRDMVLDFFHIDSKPNPDKPVGIEELKKAIAEVAADLPEMGREVPAKWQQARQALQETGKAYVSYQDAIDLCGEQGLAEWQAKIFLKISHVLGHLIHYDYDETLGDYIILKPDWLAKAISFVLDDKETRDKNGLVTFDRLSYLWNDRNRNPEDRYPQDLHPIFRRLMERFDLSYEVVFDRGSREPSETILIGQLVPDQRRTLPDTPEKGDEQQIRVCQIVDDKDRPANAEGIFYRLIVRLHKYSLGKEDHNKSIHWQRGLMLDYGYNGRALLEHIGTDVRVTVRAAYPDYFLSILTEEVKWLVENFWEGLTCKIMVPCIHPCGKDKAGTGLFELKKLIESKRKGRNEFPCNVSDCDEWQDIDKLLDKTAVSATEEASEQIKALRQELTEHFEETRERDFKQLQIITKGQKAIASKIEKQFESLMQTLVDEANEGPRLFSFQPLEPGFFDSPKWIKVKFRLTLWCEHSRLPLPALNPEGDRRGVYELDLPREWLVKTAPYLKFLTGTLGMVLPIVASGGKLVLDEAIYKEYDKELETAQEFLDLASQGSEALQTMTQEEAPSWQGTQAIRAEGATLRELHALLKEKDPKSRFGGLVKVQNKRQEFLWVHEQFVGKY
ncbi:MAG: hypothetical protein F6J93_17900 [Oscillatoria sp. SIO1A7]|nr:hypothetical protein [Oscillatoria sp. SIO1A7]